MSDGSPQGRLDPLYRAQNWRYLTSDERRGRNLAQEIKDLDFKFSLLDNAGGNIISPPAIEVLNGLPPTEPSSIGRMIIVRLPGAETSQIYSGIQKDDGSIVWQLMAENIGIADPGGPVVTLPNISRLGEISVSNVRVVAWSPFSGKLYIGRVNSNMWQYNPSNGSVSVAWSGFPGASPMTTPMSLTAVPNWADTYQSGSPRVLMYGTNAGAYGYATISYWTASGYAVDRTTGELISYGTKWSPLKNKLVQSRTGSSGTWFVSYQNWYPYYHQTSLNLNVLNLTASVNTPISIAQDGAGKFYLLNTIDKKVYEYDGGNNSSLTTWTATGTTYGSGVGSGSGQLDDPRAIYYSQGVLYVCDFNNNRIAMWSQAGTWLGSFGGTGTMNGPVSIDGNGANPEVLYVAEQGSEIVSRWQRNS